MRIPLDRQSNLPLYQQLEQHLRQQILAGNLAPETRLPATRQLASDLGISRITVENAYAALESDGLVARQAGSGTYVLPPDQLRSRQAAPPATWPLWQEDALRRSVPHPNAPRTPISPHPQPIAFTGFGDPELFSVAEFSRTIRHVMQRDGSTCLGLEDIRGYEPLRATIGHILASQGLQAPPEQIVITSGSQQALALVVQMLLKPGDTVLVETPTYDGALELFRAHHLRLVGCPSDPVGMQTEQLEPLLQQQHPRLIYVMPNFQNPTGACLSLARRRQLLALAERYNVPLLEDDFVGELRYDGHAQPALKALDRSGNVLYIGTFSKLLMPGMRLGFLVAEGPIYNLFVQQKYANDLATSALIQRALEFYISVGKYQTHVRRASQVYRKRRDAMLGALAQHFGNSIETTAPQGGLFVWARLPEGISATRLLPTALEEGVAYAPGTRFFPHPADGEAYIRLNFATTSVETIAEGVRRLRLAVRRLQP